MQINLKNYENLSPDDPRRFYPSYVPVFDYEPLRDYFTILKSPEEIREGVVSLISFEKEDLICKGTGFFLPFQTLHSLQYKEKEVYIHDPMFIGKLLHSCDPNARLEMNDFSLIALKPIKCFETITVDYNDTEAVLYQSFQCTCGSINCKGYIEGYSIKSENKESN